MQVGHATAVSRWTLRLLGWACVTAGLLLGLYLVYALFWTGRETAVAQEQLRKEWQTTVGTPAADWQLTVGTADGDITERLEDMDDRPGVGSSLPTIAFGDAVAALEFARPGSAVPPVLDQPVLVVEGVTDEALQRGPGHYPGTAMPGQPGNFAVAGHRTTYGAPFWGLDELVPGDVVRVTDRSRTAFTYEVVGSRIVAPDAVEVVSADPLGTGRPTLTLTTCNPRFSNAERLVVFAERTQDSSP